MSIGVIRQERKSDSDFMAIALDRARLGIGRTSPNPAVGAVIVKGGKILATGFHRKAGLPHAEIEALSSPPAPLLRHPKGPRFAGAGEGSRRRGEVLYVTLEPCCHHGRTPPCTDAIIRSGIKEVVVGMRDPDPKVSGKGIASLRKAEIKVRVGVLEKECRELNEAYIKHRKIGLPFVTLKIATTLDGKVGIKNQKRGKPFWITGSRARAQAHEMRDRTDAILVGVNTVLKDDPRLTTRLKGRKGKDPVRVVLDTHLRIPRTARLLHVRSKAPTWIATAAKKTKGLETVRCAKKMGRIGLRGLLKELGRRGIVTLLVEGGPTVWGAFLKEGLVDRLVLFVGQKVLGKQGISLQQLVPWFSRSFKNRD